MSDLSNKFRIIHGTSTSIKSLLIFLKMFEVAKVLSSGRLTGSKALPYLKHLVNEKKKQINISQLVQESQSSVMHLFF